MALLRLTSSMFPLANCLAARQSRDWIAFSI
jgi:hypothetical protein